MSGIFGNSRVRGALPKKSSSPGALPKTQTSKGNYHNFGGRRMKLNIVHRENQMLPHMFNPQYMSDRGAGNIQPDFPQGDVGSPFWFSNIGGNHFPREGFTYQPFDVPLIPFKDQLQGYIDDEDAKMGIEFLAHSTTGGHHYFKGKTEGLIAHIEDFAKVIQLDHIARQIAVELLAYGNSFWRLRKPIWECNSLEDFQQIPIDSAARIWWTPDRRPIWYEFRGGSYNGYFRAYEIMHFSWNQVNAQIFGYGMLPQLVKEVPYTEQTADGPQDMIRMPYLDIKHGMQNLVYRSLYRYLPRNIYEAPDSDEGERDQIRDEIRNLFPGEDLVHGARGLKVQELGSGIRAYEPNAFMDLFQGAIFKAVQTSKGRIAGQSQGPTYANGEESAVLDEVGLSFFPTSLKNQLMEKILKPWYYYNEISDPNIAGGMVNIPWDHTDYDLMFGKAMKKDLEPEQMLSWIEFLAANGAITTREIRKAAEIANVPLSSDEEGNLPGLMHPVQGQGGGLPMPQNNNVQPGLNPGGIPQSVQNLIKKNPPGTMG